MSPTPFAPRAGLRRSRTCPATCSYRAGTSGRPTSGASRYGKRNTPSRRVSWRTSIGTSPSSPRSTRPPPNGSTPAPGPASPPPPAPNQASWPACWRTCTSRTGSGCWSTGYNAALLCARLGDHLVHSVDIDPDLVCTARERMATLGFAPDLDAGDGRARHPAGRRFDRTIATCSVRRRLPAAWIEQSDPDAVIVADVDLGIEGGLVRVGVDAAGRAYGHFTQTSGDGSWPPATAPPAIRRPARPPRTPPRPSPALPRSSRQTCATTTTPFRLLLALELPEAELVHHRDDDGNTTLQLQPPDGTWVRAPADRRRQRHVRRRARPVAYGEPGGGGTSRGGRARTGSATPASPTGRPASGTSRRGDAGTCEPAGRPGGWQPTPHRSGPLRRRRAPNPQPATATRDPRPRPRSAAPAGAPHHQRRRELLQPLAA